MATHLPMTGLATGINKSRPSKIRYIMQTFNHATQAHWLADFVGRCQRRGQDTGGRWRWFSQHGGKPPALYN